MPDRKRAEPGVYIREVNPFAPSIVAVETAVPAFIGYTQKAEQSGRSARLQPIRISSMVEYFEIFGGPFRHPFNLTELTGDKDKLKGEVTLGGKSYQLVLEKRFYLYNSLRLFYANGGGSCYVVSVGSYDEKVTQAALVDSGLAAVKDLVGPTMLVIPEASLLGDVCADVARAMLSQCLSRTDRFALLDVWGADGLSPSTDIGDLTRVVEKFRKGVGSANYEALKYGAAYCPFLKTSIVDPANADEVNYTNFDAAARTTLLAGLAAEVGDSNTKLYIQYIKLMLELKSGDKGYEENRKKIGQAMAANLPAVVKKMYAVMAEKIGTLPPTGAMAGVYARTDNQHGVWNSPANVELVGVVGPTIKISDDLQEDLNIPISGLAVNAIRDFTGRGTVVWGARTLDGNSQAWRYVSVRRAVIWIEQSVKLALQQFVFEPNDAQTWAVVVSMIGNFLQRMWSAGTLMGATSQEAFSVQCGLGTTMVAQDILDGYMNVQIMLAMAHPADFIDLNIRQKMQSGPC